MITDIELLHKVVSGQVHGRGIGKTFAQCHNVAGAIELGFDNVFMVITNYRDIMYIIPMLRDVLTDHGIKIDALNYKDKIMCLGGIDKRTTVKFITEEDIYRKIRGIDKPFIVYARHGD